MKAAEAYFLAKSEMQEVLDYRIEVYEKAIVNARAEKNQDNLDYLNVRLKEVKEFRHYVRNGMLWDKSND